MKRLEFFSSDVFFNLIFNPFFILKYTLLLSNGLTLAKKNGNSGETFKRRRRKC